MAMQTEIPLTTQDIEKCIADMHKLLENVKGHKISHDYANKIRFAINAIDNLDVMVEPDYIS